MLSNRWCMTALVGMVLAGCGGDDGSMAPANMTDGGAPMAQGQQSGPSLVGDWFQCQHGDCNMLNDEGGIRFSEDGKWIDLADPTSGNLLGQAYCAHQDRTGTYAIADGTLTLQWSDGSTPTIFAHFTQEGDVFKGTRHHPTDPSRDSDIVYLKIGPSRAQSTGACR